MHGASKLRDTLADNKREMNDVKMNKTIWRMKWGKVRPGRNPRNQSRKFYWLRWEEMLESTGLELVRKLEWSEWARDACAIDKVGGWDRSNFR